MKNRLSTASSPYLLQHANQPVHWQSWTDEPFEEAKRRDCPVFLSIGYATCHWCHVMAHESFDDPDVARILNSDFVSVKVDREEFPDLDRAAMQVCQMVHGRGGWPLHLILTPGKQPFFAATYLPKRSRFGQPGLIETLQSLSDHWKKERKRVLKAAEAIESGYRSLIDPEPGDKIDPKRIRQAIRSGGDSFDPTYGGFGDAPKFPMGHSLLCFLEAGTTQSDSALRVRALFTIEQIVRGGITDQLEGGIHRYATDREWRLPHFEKMLYDQAIWLLTVSEAYRHHASPLLLQNLERTIDYLERRLCSPEGAFYCGEDADSDGEEGSFYLWRVEETESSLNDKQLELFLQTYNVSRKGNIVPEGQPSPDGRNVLYRTPLPPYNDEDPPIHPAFPSPPWEDTLRTIRSQRTRPDLDDKILTDWNALAVAGLARSGAITGRPEWIERACRVARTLQRLLKNENGQWLHRYRNDHAGIAATSNDYASLLWAWLELYKATFDPMWLQEGLQLAEEWVENFSDHQTGAFYLCRNGNDPLFEKQKPLDDGALPSCNSIATHQLIHLGILTGNPEWLNRAHQILEWASGAAFKWPGGHLHTLHALSLIHERHPLVVVTGEENADETKKMIRYIHQSPGPARWASLLTPDRREAMTQLAPWMESLPRTKDTTAWICYQTHCEEKITDSDQLRERLKRMG
ncbi:MAG: thioredoxin domain-containing protein [Bacteroidota bacterium]